MNTLSDISIGPFMILVFILLFELYYLIEKKDETDIKNFIELDANRDGIVTRKELKRYLTILKDQQKKDTFHHDELVKIVFTGIIRGCLTGIILNNFEGGIALGIMSGILDPIVAGMKKMIS